ncbi:hypothetical protein ACFL6I_25300, partial [candidate division KSB1 bacterium]
MVHSLATFFSNIEPGIFGNTGGAAASTQSGYPTSFETFLARTLPKVVVDEVSRIDSPAGRAAAQAFQKHSDTISADTIIRPEQENAVEAKPSVLLRTPLKNYQIEFASKPVSSAAVKPEPAHSAYKQLITLKDVSAIIDASVVDKPGEASMNNLFLELEIPVIGENTQAKRTVVVPANLIGNVRDASGEISDQSQSGFGGSFIINLDQLKHILGLALQNNAMQQILPGENDKPVAAETALQSDKVFNESSPADNGLINSFNGDNTHMIDGQSHLFVMNRTTEQNGLSYIADENAVNDRIRKLAEAEFIRENENNVNHKTGFIETDQARRSLDDFMLRHPEIFVVELKESGTNNGNITGLGEPFDSEIESTPSNDPAPTNMHGHSSTLTGKELGPDQKKLLNSINFMQLASVSEPPEPEVLLHEYTSDQSNNTVRLTIKIEDLRNALSAVADRVFTLPGEEIIDALHESAEKDLSVPLRLGVTIQAQNGGAQDIPEPQGTALREDSKIASVNRDFSPGFIAFDEDLSNSPLIGFIKSLEESFGKEIAEIVVADGKQQGNADGDYEKILTGGKLNNGSGVNPGQDRGVIDRFTFEIPVDTELLIPDDSVRMLRDLYLSQTYQQNNSKNFSPVISEEAKIGNQHTILSSPKNGLDALTKLIETLPSDIQKDISSITLVLPRYSGKSEGALPDESSVSDGRMTGMTRSGQMPNVSTDEMNLNSSSLTLRREVSITGLKTDGTVIVVEISENIQSAEDPDSGPVKSEIIINRAEFEKQYASAENQKTDYIEFKSVMQREGGQPVKLIV